MKAKNFISGIVLVILCACSSQEKEPQSVEENLSARELVAANAYIDVPEYIEGKTWRYGCGSPADNKLRAATYRFLKHVKMENGKYVCDLTSGEDINISPALFDGLYKEHVTDVNQWIDEVHERGNKAMVLEMKDEYFEAMLDGKPFGGVGVGI